MTGSGYTNAGGAPLMQPLGTTGRQGMGRVAEA